MILGAFIINGQPVGAVLQNWQTSDLGANAPFVFEDSLNNNYQDISSVENIYKFGHLTKYDFKKVRDEMKNFVIALGNSNIISEETNPATLSPSVDDGYLIGAGAIGEWAGKDGQVAKYDGAVWIYFNGDGIASAIETFGFSYLNATDAKIAAAHLIGSIGQQIVAYNYNAEEKEKEQFLYKINVQECRKSRFEWAENHFLQQIPAQTAEVLGVIEMNYLGSRYYEHGLDGIAEFGDVAEGVADYIDGAAGTIFENIGIRQKPWVTLFGSNMSTFCDELKEKLFYTGLIIDDYE